MLSLSHAPPLVSLRIEMQILGDDKALSVFQSVVTLNQVIKIKMKTRQKHSEMRTQGINLKVLVICRKQQLSTANEELYPSRKSRGSMKSLELLKTMCN